MEALTASRLQLEGPVQGTDEVRHDQQLGERQGVAAVSAAAGDLHHPDAIALNDDEIVTEVRLPAMDGYDFAYLKFTRRAEDWQTLQAWIVRKVFEPNARGLGSSAFGQQVERIFSELYPLYVFTSVASPKWQSELKRAA